MSISGSIEEQIGQLLSETLHLDVEVEQSTAVGGGSINDAWRIDTNEGRFFLKTNSADRFPSMFTAEAHGLQLLQKAGALAVPKVIGKGDDHDTSWLLIEWIESGPKTTQFWKEFGMGLATLHQNTADTFGLDRNNYIGSLVQKNDRTATWSQFFIQQRLEPMLKMARDARRMEAGSAFRFEKVFQRLETLFPKEVPALLHGDLWSGNFMAGTTGQAWVIDPAVYYGHREMDIAMTNLFGGTDQAFYDAYNEHFPLEKSWEDRIDLCNLYPLMVHVNLFGGTYVEQVEAVLVKYA